MATKLGARPGRRIGALFRSGAIRELIPSTRPRVGSISPNNGPSAGGTTITITGVNFTGVTAVNFGSIAAASFTFVSDNQIIATSPAGSGAIFVTVVTPEGVSPGSAANRFSYAAAPTVTNLNPNTGPIAGGTTVTISGTGFTPTSTVVFGATAVAVTFVSASQLTVVSPAAAAGAVNVRVTNTEGTSAIAPGNVFTYGLPAPTIINLNPNTGATTGGTAVTITGTNFTGVTSVNFGGTVLSAIAAPGAPSVGSINPTSGVAGTPVTITGTGFIDTPGFIFVSATQINVITPPGTAGAANVTVTTPNGTSAPATFTYVSQSPTVASINPTSGLAGTTVTITGTNFS
jgi:hypothetical protein